VLTTSDPMSLGIPNPKDKVTVRIPTIGGQDQIVAKGRQELLRPEDASNPKVEESGKIRSAPEQTEGSRGSGNLNRDDNMGSWG